MKSLADLAFEEEEARNAPKPASAYVAIPDWLEAEIMALDADNIACFASSHQEDIMMRTKYGYDKLKQVTNDAIAVIKEWK